jgi:hypothetical protein
MNQKGDSLLEESNAANAKFRIYHHSCSPVKIDPLTEISLATLV